MDQEERRLAMLRMRGELPQEEEEKEAPKKQNYGNKKKKKQPQKRSLMSRKEIMRRRRRFLAIARLVLYLAAFIVLVLVVVTVFKSCRQGDNEPGMENKTKAQTEQPSSSDSEETAAQEPEETTAASVENVTADSRETQESENTASGVVAVNAGIPIDASRIAIPDWVEQDLLPVNDMSRPGTKLKEIKYIAIHWVGNPSTTAKANRDYFESLAETKERKASSQFVVGLDGEVIQCMPLDELAYAVKDKFNPYTISIEVCHPDDEGKFKDVTYQSVVKLTAWLMQQFGLEKDAIIRHYDCTGKYCPKYYVEHEDAWNQLKDDVMDYKEKNPNIS